MSRRLIVVMVVAVLSCFALILMMNVASLVGVIPARYISADNVRGMAVQHNGKLYTLNFEQQNTFAELFNRTFPVDESAVVDRKATDLPPPEAQKIIIYRFNTPDIEITPLSYIIKNSSLLAHDPIEDINFIFSAPEWNPHGLLEENAADSLYAILPTTYDK